jgi:hypothetical protein
MTTRRCARTKAGPLAEVTKRDFVAIAEILCEEKATTSLKERMASYFRSQNPRFDNERFMRATNACRTRSTARRTVSA